MNEEQMAIEFKKSVTDELISRGFSAKDCSKYKANYLRIGPIQFTVEDVYKIAGESKSVEVAAKLYVDLIIQQVEDRFQDKSITLPENYKSKSYFDIITYTVVRGRKYIRFDGAFDIYGYDE